MSVARRSAVAAALIAGLTLTGCGSDDQAETASGDNPACKVLQTTAVEAIVPGAQRDDMRLPSTTACFYKSLDRDLTVSYFSEDQLPKGPGGGEPTLQDVYDMALFDASSDGAAKVRSAPTLGDDGKLAVDADEGRVVAVWKRDDAIYVLDYLFGQQPADDATRDLTTLAGKVKPPG